MEKNHKSSKKRATSYDVAQLAGVSQSAVSRCFQPNASVSKKMRAKIEAAAEELGYMPNAMARGLITRRTNIVAIVLNHITNLVYPEVLYQFDQALAKQGIHVLLFTLGEERKVDDVVQQILQYQVDGIIAATTFEPKHVQQCKERQIPIVFYNRVFEDTDTSFVCCDHAGGERTLVSGLLNAGKKDFLVISGPKDNSVSTARTQGVVAQLEAMGAKYSLVYGDYSYESGCDLIHSHFSKDKVKTDAVICANDGMAIGCIDTLRIDLGIEIPREISVVGFDGIGPSHWKSYDLTTIVQPINRLINATVNMLMERIEDPDLPAERRMLVGSLHRGSTAQLE